MDPNLIRQAQLGDRPSQARLLRDLQDDWFRFCLSQLRDSELAGDAVQETGLRVLTSLSRFDERSSFKTWSFGVALNVCRELRRKQLRLGGGFGEDGEEPADDLRSALLGRDGDNGPAEATVRREDVEALRTVLATLPVRQREVVAFRVFEDLSVQETARAMKCAEGTVKATLFAAMRNLRDKLGGQRRTPEVRP